MAFTTQLPSLGAGEGGHSGAAEAGDLLPLLFPCPFPDRRGRHGYALWQWQTAYLPWPACCGRAVLGLEMERSKLLCLEPSAWELGGDGAGGPGMGGHCGGAYPPCPCMYLSAFPAMPVLLELLPPNGVSSLPHGMSWCLAGGGGGGHIGPEPVPSEDLPGYARGACPPACHPPRKEGGMAGMPAQGMVWAGRRAFFYKQLGRGRQGQCPSESGTDCLPWHFGRWRRWHAMRREDLGYPGGILYLQKGREEGHDLLCLPPACP